MAFGVSRNPTKLEIGMTGLLDGRAVTVIGRALLESAHNDRWQEYYVQMEGGPLVTIVFERGVWKRFEDFIPKKGVDADEAASYRCNDTVWIDEHRYSITYVSASFVRYAEGRPIEGVKVGSHARYFNATAGGGDLLVASWTGSEIEFYSGRILENDVIPQAFQMPAPSRLSSIGYKLRDGATPQVRIVVVVLVLLGLFSWMIIASSGSRDPMVDPPPVAPASPVKLRDQARGTIDGTEYVVQGGSTEEIDEVGIRFKRREYELIDTQGGHFQLIQSLKGDAAAWYLFHSIATPSEDTPKWMGKLRANNRVRLGGEDATVRILFLDRPVLRDSAGVIARGDRTLRYGLVAQAGGDWIMARWTESRVELELGQAVPETEVLRAFAAADSK